MKKSTVFLAIIVLIISFLAIYFTSSGSSKKNNQHNANTNVAEAPVNNNSNSTQLSQDELVNLAKQKFQEFKNDGMNMSYGPCLGQIADDWVADVAHNPRQDIDNDIFNECSDYIYGRAHHFVELDPDGNLIRVN